MWFGLEFRRACRELISVEGKALNLPLKTPNAKRNGCMREIAQPQVLPRGSCEGSFLCGLKELRNACRALTPHFAKSPEFQSCGAELQASRSQYLMVYLRAGGSWSTALVMLSAISCEV